MSTQPEPAQECEFVPAHEPWECRIHRGVRTRLDEPQCDIARPAEPFNDAYLDNIRQGIAEGRNPGSRYNVRRLLATIDREREATAAARAEVARQVREVVERRLVAFYTTRHEPHEDKLRRCVACGRLSQFVDLEADESAAPVTHEPDCQVAELLAEVGLLEDAVETRPEWEDETGEVIDCGCPFRGHGFRHASTGTQP